MNKNEQSQLCMLLAKLRYDIMETIIGATNEKFIKEQNTLIEAINKILGYSYIDNKEIK